MPSKRGGRTPSRNTPQRGGGAGGTVLAFVLGAAAAAGAGYLYLHSAPRRNESAPIPTPQMALNDHANPPAAAPALKVGSPRPAPFGTSEDVFESGAHLYAAHCSSCHGTPQHDATSKPSAQQLWRKARTVIAKQTPSELYEEISAGAPGKGMPAYAGTLTDTQLWQLALLLKNADQDLPDPVVHILGTSAKP